MAAVMTTFVVQTPCASSADTRSTSGKIISSVSSAHRQRQRARSAVRVHAASEVNSTKLKKESATAAAATLFASFSMAALVVLPAFAEEAASSASEISPFAGVVDVTVLAAVGLLAVQGNKKAEAAKAAQGGKKGTKKK